MTPQTAIIGTVIVMGFVHLLVLGFLYWKLRPLLKRLTGPALGTVVLDRLAKIEALINPAATAAKAP